VVRVDNELSSPAPKALPAGSRCILKRKECRSVGIAEKLLRDVRTLSHLEHPNVIKYFGVLLGSAATDVLLVCEFCTGGSLQDLIYHQRREKRSDSRDDGNLFAPELVLEFLLQLSSALTYLHDGVGLAHGNLTSTNAVLDGTGVIKITDVGLEDALDDPEYDPTRDVRDVAALRHERASIGFWAPERSLRNVSTGGFLPSGPSAPADCWALGCVATELSSGIFVHERLNACEGVSLALEHECLSAAIRHLDNVTSCGRCGQSGRDICAGCRVAWVAAALLARDPMRRPASSRAKSLLETCSWISGAEPAKVGSMLVPPLSIPPPSYCLSRDKSAHTTRGALAGRQCGSDTGNGPARHSGHDGMALVSALREALDGPDWRVFKDGKLLPSEWHHDKIIYSINGSAHGTNPAPDRGSQTDADLPHERGREISYQKMNGYADTGESEAAESPRWESLTERQKERRERAERRAASRGLADLYREAKHKQRPGGQVEEDVIPAPPNKAKHAGVGGVGGGVCATKDGADAASGVRVPKSSLKEGLGSSSGEQEQQAQPRAQGSGVKLGIGGVQGIEALLASVKAPAKQQVPRGSEVPLGSQGSDTVCSADKAAGRDLWDEWLSSLGGSPVAMHGDAAEDVEEDAASEASGGAELVGAEGADSLVGGDEDDGAGEMGPQDTVSADMQVGRERKRAFDGRGGGSE
jgi:serine/threonine protein kinase